MQFSTVQSLSTAMQLFTSPEQYLTRTLQTEFFLHTVLTQRNRQATKKKTKQAMQTQGQDYFPLRMNVLCFWDSFYGNPGKSIPCFHQLQMPQHNMTFDLLVAYMTTVLSTVSVALMTFSNEGDSTTLFQKLVY